MLPCLFLCLLVVGNVNAKLYWESRQFLESNAAFSLPDGWSDLGVAEPSAVVTVTFVLHIEQPQKLEKMAALVSDPASPLYTHYYSFEKLIAEHGPAPWKVELISGWLERAGVSRDEISVTPTRDFITTRMPVSVANQLFDITLHEYSHSEFGKTIRTTEPYSVPVPVHSILAFVSGLIRFPDKGQIRAIVSSEQKRQTGGITPSYIWNAFHTGGIAGTNETNSMAVAQFLGQFYDPNDLLAFESEYDLPHATVTLEGPNDPSNPGVEASLDIEYITGTAPGVPSYFWSTAGEHQGQERFVFWATGLNSRPTLPWVHSVSYGDTESSVTLTYAARLEQELMKLALRGVTVLFASGDDGVGCGGSCVNAPNWPASSPYVTAVGGFFSNLAGDPISSGGFSNYFAQPSWQQAAVSHYLNTNSNLPPSNQYNASGRAMPDVAAFSEDVEVISGGNWFPVGGTSCASPTFAAVIALINDALLNENKKPVGAINAALYTIGASNPKAFIDITQGNNAKGCCSGFEAQTGWDPQTGWGGPNFPVLKQSFMALQSKN